MLSRVARNLYWLGRYLERAENTARIVVVHSHLLMDLPAQMSLGWEPLINIVGTEGDFFQHHPQADENAVVHHLLCETDNPDSIASTLAQARENLRTTREVFPREAWEQLNDLHLLVQQKMQNPISKYARHDLLKSVIHEIQQIHGLLHDNMSRGQAYDFLSMGISLERAEMTSRIVDVRSANVLHSLENTPSNLQPFENIQWMSILKSLNAYQMYRQHNHIAKVSSGLVLDFLLKNTQFPRACQYCINELQLSLNRLPDNPAALQAVKTLSTQIADIAVAPLTEQVTRLHDFIEQLQMSMADLNQQITHAYFD